MVLKIKGSVVLSPETLIEAEFDSKHPPVKEKTLAALCVRLSRLGSSSGHHHDEHQVWSRREYRISIIE